MNVTLLSDRGDQSVVVSCLLLLNEYDYNGNQYTSTFDKDSQPRRGFWAACLECFLAAGILYEAALVYPPCSLSIVLRT